jgi:hypothetical protein
MNAEEERISAVWHDRPERADFLFFIRGVRIALVASPSGSSKKSRPGAATYYASRTNPAFFRAYPFPALAPGCLAKRKVLGACPSAIPLPAYRPIQ